MGCDIHLHIEVKIGDVWHHWGAPQVDRSYALFAVMAGVRNYNEVVPITMPRGLPDDLTTLTRLSATYWGADGHSHSWLGVEEIVQLEEWLARQDREWPYGDLECGILGTYLFGNSFTGWHCYPDENCHDVQDVRFVFWFDN